MFVFKRVKPVIKHDREAQAIVDKLESFLQQESPQLVYWIQEVFERQVNSITYAELQQAVLDGYEQQIRKWQEDYAQFVNEKLVPIWSASIQAGAAQLRNRLKDFVFDDSDRNVKDWIRIHSGEFITNIGEDTRAAIKAIFAHGQDEGWNPQRMAQAIRPCIGLTRPDAIANAHYQQSVYENLLKTTTPEKAVRQAHEAALRYGEKQHCARAEMIANTELAFAYNKGHHEGVRQAMAQGLMGACEKIWTTAGSRRVCDKCLALNGQRIGFDDSFNFAGKELYRGMHQTPPAHPRCRCVVRYVEYLPPARKSESLAPNNGMIRSESEFLKRANYFKPIIEQSVGRASKWSGVLNFDYMDNAYSAKEWNCAIRLAKDATDHVLLHEMVHSCSVSYEKSDAYLRFPYAEELPVHLMSQELVNRLGLEIDLSAYDDGVQILRDFKTAINYAGSFEEFARAILNQSIADRFDWLENVIQESLGLNATVEQYQFATSLLNAIVEWRPTL